ncbi:MAG: hypothetical protein HGA85_02165 [Nanoarchaeota archaeon]|nr:hypothetical protein [Nanoarchaeota archaeon]
MKKKLSLLLFVGMLFFSQLVNADVMPENSHPLERCIKLVNLDDSPDVVLIGYYTGPMIKSYEAYQIEDNKCLQKGYKFNKLSIYWTTKEKFGTLDLKNLKLDSEKVLTSAKDMEGNPVYADRFFPAELTRLLENVEPFGGFVDNSDPLVKEEVEYSLAEDSKGDIIIYKSKQTSEYSNGQPPKEVVFEKPNPEENPVVPVEPTADPEPQPAKRSFWDSISCFFKSLFGGSC